MQAIQLTKYGQHEEGDTKKGKRDPQIAPISPISPI